MNTSNATWTSPTYKVFNELKSSRMLSSDLAMVNLLPVSEDSYNYCQIFDG